MIFSEGPFLSEQVEETDLITTTFVLTFCETKYFRSSLEICVVLVIYLLFPLTSWCDIQCIPNNFYLIFSTIYYPNFLIRSTLCLLYQTQPDHFSLSSTTLNKIAWPDSKPCRSFFAYPFPSLPLYKPQLLIFSKYSSQVST